jgi:hypothetical protein
MYLNSSGNLGQVPTTPMSRTPMAGKHAVQCEAIPEKYSLRDRKPVTSGRANCPTQANALQILRRTIKDAVEMLNNTIGELVRAREAACRGEPLGWPALSDLTACWLKYRLGVCIDDPLAWTKGAFRKSQAESPSVAEVIRRLAVPRNLLASNQITYICEPACDEGTNAFTIVRQNGVCIRTPERVIHLCPTFWSDAHAPFREQTIIHEAVHLTHCASHQSPPPGPQHNIERATGIGWPECLAQFVVATNGKRLDRGQRTRCAFSKKCGQVSESCKKAMSGNPTKDGGARSRRTLPDWKP